MLTKNDRNNIKALRLRENRWREKRMVVEGSKGVIELLNSSTETLQIYVTNSCDIREIRILAEAKQINICEVTTKDMDIMSSMRTAPGVLAVGRIKNTDIEEIISRLNSGDENVVPTILMLDDLADPGNVGTLIRMADWFGLAGIVSSMRTVDIWNSKVIQSSMGSVFHIPICIADPLMIINTFSLEAVALDAHGESLYSSEFWPKALIVGSESHGLHPDLLKVCSETWAIPGKGKAESLNAAVAGAVVTAELGRRWAVMNG